MRFKKFFCGAVAASMIFSASMYCSAASEDSANAKLAKIEIDTYGSEQSGAILDRISRLEKNYNGQNLNGNMNARIDAVYDILYDNATAPGILAKLNALEWNTNHEAQSGGVDTRLAALETQILGKVNEGTFNERIRSLARQSYGAEILPIVQVPLPANLLIKVATTIPVGSKTFQEGDIIPIKVVEDVFVDGSLVFIKGLPGEGVVTKVRRAKSIFTNGKIDTDFYTLKAIDGQDVNVTTGVEAVNAMADAQMARGLSLLGQTFSGKHKEIDSVLVRGKNVDLPAGIELYVQLKSPITVYGVKATDDGLYLDEKAATVPTPPAPIQTKPTPPVQPPQPEPPISDDDLIEIVDDEPSVTSTTPITPTTPTTPTKPAEPATPPPPPPAQPATPDYAEGELTDDELTATPPLVEEYDGEIIEIIDEE